MLKACCDCIAAANPREHHDAYGNAIPRVNGVTHGAPPWPQARHNETMYLLPKRLAANDGIEIIGRLTDGPRELTINLVTGDSSPDYNNIACQVEARFPPSGENRLSFRTVYNGYTEELSGDYQTTDWFTGNELNFVFSIRMNGDYEEDGHRVQIQIEGNDIREVILKHNINDIRFLTLHGDIEKIQQLHFNFG